MATERIPLHRAYAVVTDASIAVYPSRAQVLGASIEIAIAGIAVALIVVLFEVLPLLVMVVLLLLALLLGPIGVLGLVFGMVGTSFLMEREPGTARWQQGFLGMGIGTTEFVAFPRIEAIAVDSDADAELPGGDRQDVITWDVVLVKDNDRRLSVGTVVAARSLVEFGAERANRLAAALAEMAGVEARLASVPSSAAEASPAPAAARPRRRYRRVSTGEPRKEAE